MLESGLTIALAYLLDLWIGDPRYAWHPVKLIGRVIGHSERILRNHRLDGKWGGAFLVLVTACTSLLGYFCLVALFAWLHPLALFFLQLYVTYSCLALGDLLGHVQPLVKALDAKDLAQARECVAQVVGREVRVLDEYGVARAALESLGENFVDGFLSPLFWFCFGWAVSVHFHGHDMTWAVALMLFFKVASTLDSMVGYKDPRYLHFGWAGARLDDLMNFLPARLSVLLLFLGAAITGLNGREGFRVAMRDRLKHDSPNSAHGESFLAGALNVRLGGPTLYPHGLKSKPWLGTGRIEVGPEDIRRTMGLLRATGWIAVLATLLVIFAVSS